MKRMILLGLIILFCFMIDFAGQAQQSTVMIIMGDVKDSVTGNPISGTTISANIDVSPVQTDRNGNFRFIVMTPNPIVVKAYKEGYSTYEKLLSPQERVELSIRLTPQTSQVRIVMTSFRTNDSISGRVEGLSARDYKDYKILVYVLTNKWYIHPWAENVEGRGFANIRNDGTWRIGTVWRGYQAYRVAFLLTGQSTYSPPTVEIISDNPDKDLLSRIAPVAYSIIDAPVGI
jgi:hypothetical protein